MFALYLWYIPYMYADVSNWLLDDVRFSHIKYDLLMCIRTVNMVLQKGYYATYSSYKKNGINFFTT